MVKCNLQKSKCANILGRRVYAQQKYSTMQDDVVLWSEHPQEFARLPNFT
jgi:hypothetical protein